MTIRPIRTMMNHATTEIFFDNLRVPAENLIGEEGKGFRYILSGMNAERILIAAECIGDAQWFIEKATAYAKERNVFGRPIGQNQGIQFPIAQGLRPHARRRSDGARGGRLYEAGEPCGAEANMAKLLAADASWEAANACVQTHGGFGFAEEYDVERKFRETRLYQVAPISTNLILASRRPSTCSGCRSGVACLTWSLDTIGPITRSLRDLRLVTAIIADRSPDAPVPAVSALRFAVPHPSLLEGCEPEVADLFNALVSRLERGGATVRQAGFPQLEFGKLRRAALLIAEVEGACLLEAELSKPDRYSDGFRAMLDYGRNASAARVALAYREIRQARLSFSASLAQVDALLLPTTPQRAFPHDDPVPANQADFTVLASAADAPAIAMPLPADTGLPASAQLIGSPCAEGRLLAIAETLLQDGVVARRGR
jgi:hypothetical protein